MNIWQWILSTIGLIAALFCVGTGAIGVFVAIKQSDPEASTVFSGFMILLGIAAAIVLLTRFMVGWAA